MKSRWLLAALALGASAGAAGAADIHVACYSDGNECEALVDEVTAFGKDNPDVHVIVDKSPYAAIMQSLPVQLAAGNGPDIARVTDFGPLMRYFLDLRPYLKDADAWEANFGKTLPWMRANDADKGIYGLPSQLTVTGLIVDKSLFDQAGVALPGDTATWDDWASALKKVADADKVPFAMAWDRSGHRFAGPAISYGAKYFAADGAPIAVDDGVKAVASRLAAWSKDGTFDKDVWVAAGSGYRDAFEDFANGQIVAYFSGSWQVSRLQKQVADGFDWKVVPAPCGPAACTGMPGGTSFVAFRQTQHPQEVARFLDWLSQAPHYADYMAKTSNIPAHQGLKRGDIAYTLSPAGVAALQTFVDAAGKLAPLAYRLQGYAYSRSIFNPTVDRISQALSGQITLDQAYERIDSDLAAALAAAKK